MLSLITQALALNVSPLATSTLPGNVNFDPLGLASRDFSFAKSPRSQRRLLFDYREAELKHSRLAMLAAVAYPIQEKLNPVLSSRLGLPNLLPEMKLSPSLVNGGLDPAVTVAFLGLSAGLELSKMNNESEIEGDYNWRLTSSVPGTPEFKELQAGEIWNGRVAMVAVLGYVVQEALTKTPVLF